MQPQPLTFGVVLAGGQSKRMGQDKALLQIGGKILLTHTLDVLNAVKPKLDKIVVSGRQSEVSSIKDIYQHLGPVGGIYSVVRTIQTCSEQVGYLLVMPVDMPFMTPQALNHLINQAKNSRSYNAFVYRGNLLPLLIRLTPGVFNFFEKSLQPLHYENKSRSIHNLLEHLDKCEINWDLKEEKLFVNVNTQKDLALIC